MTAEEARKVTSNQLNKHIEGLNNSIKSAAEDGFHYCTYQFIYDKKLASDLCKYLRDNGFKYNLSSLEGFSSWFYQLRIEWGKENERMGLWNQIWNKVVKVVRMGDGNHHGRGRSRITGERV